MTRGQNDGMTIERENGGTKGRKDEREASVSEMRSYRLFKRINNVRAAVRYC
jgi:hypothetical protein